MQIDIHTHKNCTDKNTISILNINYSKSTKPSKQILLSAGIHPWDIKNIKQINYNFLNKNLFAVGEIGLDKTIDTPLYLQKDIFISQIKIANKLNLPIIIHCVKAIQEIIEIKTKHAPNNIWIYHGFNKNKQIAEQLLKHNFMLSFGKDLFLGKNQNTISKIPSDKIFLETDNSDYKINDIYSQAAKLTNININSLEDIIYNNFLKLRIRD